jgi:biopolymer transport protein ExbD
MKLTSRAGRREHTVELAMTSMIDVVFLLLIFFMTTSSFVKTERNLDPAIKLRERSASEAARDLEPAIVEVRGSGGRFVYRVGGRDMTSVDELTLVLRQFADKSDAMVQVSDEAPFAMAAAAVQACKTAGFFLVSYVPAGRE